MILPSPFDAVVKLGKDMVAKRFGAISLATWPDVKTLDRELDSLKVTTQIHRNW